MLHRKILALSRRYASSECNSNNSLNPRCIMVVAMASSVPSEIDWRRVLLIAAHTNYSDTLTYEIYEHDLIFHHKQLHIHYLQIIHKVLLEVPSAELPSSQSKTSLSFSATFRYILLCGHLPRPHAAAAVAASSVHPCVLHAAAPSPPLASGRTTWSPANGRSPWSFSVPIQSSIM